MTTSIDDEKIEKEKKRLFQRKFIEFIKKDVRTSEMLTVYYNKKTENEDITIYCAFIPNDQIEKSLNNTSWELTPGSGGPGVIEYHQGGEIRKEYFRLGDGSGIEPFILYRDFYGRKPKYKEICEEFRLIHNLYHDRKDDKYIKIDDAGNEHVVAIIEPDCIKIRLKEIKQFLAIREMHLAIFFDCIIHSEANLEELGLIEGYLEQKSEGLLTYDLSYGNQPEFDGMHSFSRLLGKYLIKPFPKEKIGIWGFSDEEKKEYASFIIDVNNEDDDVLFTSNPEKLANFFGKNPDKPNFLTPVFFRREVLDKYFKQPSKYEVSDGHLGCCGLWALNIDNHHDDYVVVFLGYLGQDLPHEEQLHWKSYNIQPCGGISEITFCRAFQGQPVDSNRPEHIFSNRYYALQENSVKILGWPILLPLEKGDEHYLKAIRIPSTEEQKDFDELIQSLAKVLIDSLNEKKLNEFILKEEQGSIKGSIARLERVFEEKRIKDYEDYIKFLRNLQNLRSAGSAHRKGSEYGKVIKAFNIENQSLKEVFSQILEKGIEVLQFLDFVVQSRCLLPDDNPSGEAK